jgi:glycosyltransferase involved in cell wall biosynthesis
MPEGDTSGVRDQFSRAMRAPVVDEVRTVADPAHVVLIPSYNTGARLFGTLAEVRRLKQPVLVVVDGSTDGTDETLEHLAADDPALHVCVLSRNEGKGAAVLHGLRAALALGFTHALTMDADGQHSAAHIDEMIAMSRMHPEAMILGTPVFDESAPRIRIFGHKVSNFCSGLVTKQRVAGGVLFGFRVYPVLRLIEAFERTTRMRGFDFDSEAAIRLCWSGVLPINVPTPVRYFHRNDGGVSHFKYVRDNFLLAAMYGRLLGERLVHFIRR